MYREPHFRYTILRRCLCPALLFLPLIFIFIPLKEQIPRASSRRVAIQKGKLQHKYVVMTLMSLLIFPDKTSWTHLMRMLTPKDAFGLCLFSCLSLPAPNRNFHRVEIHQDNQEFVLRLTYFWHKDARRERGEEAE